MLKQSHLHLRLLGAASVAPNSTKDKEDVCAKLGKWRHQHFYLQTIISALQTAPDKASSVVFCTATAPVKPVLGGFPGVSFPTIAAETLRGAQMSCLNLPVN